jgi:hypothetical protein
MKSPIRRLEPADSIGFLAPAPSPDYAASSRLRLACMGRLAVARPWICGRQGPGFIIGLGQRSIQRHGECRIAADNIVPQHVLSLAAAFQGQLEAGLVERHDIGAPVDRQFPLQRAMESRHHAAYATPGPLARHTWRNVGILLHRTKGVRACARLHAAVA